MKLIAMLSSLALGIVLAGCGKPDQQAAPSGAAAQPKAVPDKIVVIEANDLMKYNLERFSVNAGDTVQLTLKNVGTMPKFSMGHNVVIFTKGANVQAFVEAAMTSAASDYIPASRAGEVIAHSKLLGGGESDTIVFVAPASKGEYPFACSFPGHLQVGMKGVMQVN